jgi:hypothetical protein
LTLAGRLSKRGKGAVVKSVLVPRLGWRLIDAHRRSQPAQRWLVVASGLDKSNIIRRPSPQDQQVIITPLPLSSYTLCTI